MTTHLSPHSHLSKRVVVASRLALVVLAGDIFVIARAQPPAAIAPAAAAGSIEGRVLNAATGEFVRNAVIAVTGTSLRTLSNANGEYRLTTVPTGPVTVIATYPGQNEIAVRLSVEPGASVRHEFTFDQLSESGSDKAIQLDAFTVTARTLNATSAALLEQRTAANVKSVVALDEFGDLGVSNMGHYLRYIPGVAALNTTGEIETVTVRGMPADGTVVLVDGAHAATNGEDRGFNFSGSFSPSNIDRVEVTKVPTPDIPANAIGGSINMISKSARSFSKPSLKFSGFVSFMGYKHTGNMDLKLGKSAGPDPSTTIRPVNPGFDLQYMLPLNDRFALSFTAGHSLRRQERRYLVRSYDYVKAQLTEQRDNPLLNIFDQDNATLALDTRIGRGIARVQMEYTDLLTLTRQNLRRYVFGANAVTDSDVAVGAANSVGQVVDQGGQTNQDRKMLNTRFSYRYDGTVSKFDFLASHSSANRHHRSVTDSQFNSHNASLTGLILSATALGRIENLELPTITVTTAAHVPVEGGDVRNLNLNTATGQEMYFFDTTDSVAANYSRDFALRVPFTVKVGGSDERMRREQRQESLSWTFSPPASAGGQKVANYDIIATDFSARLSQKYPEAATTMISDKKLYDLFLKNPNYFVEDANGDLQRRINTSKFLQETITAGYVMGDTRLFANRLRLVAGVRWEMTDDRGAGLKRDPNAIYVKDANGNLARTSTGALIPITNDAIERTKLTYQERALKAHKTYNDFYPSFNASYDVTKSIVARFGYAKTMGRPSLSFIVPNAIIADPSSAAASRVITVVNTALQPWSANIYDLSLEMYEKKGATVSVGVFRKEISNFFTSVRTPATPELLDFYNLTPDLIGYDISAMTNSPDSVVTNGLEWSVRQSLRPFAGLPLWLRGLQGYVNGTHLRLSGPGVSNFAGYTPKTINFGITYALPRFIARVNVNYAGYSRGANLAASATTPAGSYQSIAPRTTVSASVEYRLFKHLSTQLTAQNLNNSYYRNQNIAPGAPMWTRPNSYRDIGIEYVFGLRGEY
jgi:iron complex outermembrane recepter protein